MSDLVAFGAPEDILVQGKPHLGTDKMVQILRAVRRRLVDELGVDVRFGHKVAGVAVGKGSRAEGVELIGGEIVKASSVVLAAGHSAREMFERMHAEKKIQARLCHLFNVV